MGFWEDLGNTVAKAAPLLGGAIAGPGGAAIGQLVASAFGVDANDPQALQAAITQDPQAAVKLRELEMRHKERLEELAFQRHKADLEAETSRHAESQATIRTEAEHGTEYVKETRPKMARLAGYATVAYCLGAELAKHIGLLAGTATPLPGADVTVASMLFAPLGTYMTMRTFDGFTRKGRS